ARGTYVTVHAHNNAGIRNTVLAGVRCVEHGTDIDAPTAELMREHDVALIPTFAIIEQLADTEGMGLEADARERISGVRERMASALTLATEAGLRVGLGSDLIGPNQGRRGEELRLRAELQTPMQALVSATSINAEILGLKETVGMIGEGMLADLVVWQQDPLQNANNFADPDMAAIVIKTGRIVKKEN
ncbi:MAG: amidohydrolase family protein, partial [Kocuria sp.]|nr:amidohydrolase family protein [Kocuria sp.]